MKLLNNQFEEINLGYNSWKAFVNEAIKYTGIIYEENAFSFNKKNENTIPEIFKQLLDNVGKSNEWILFTKIAPKINFKEYGYNRFKKLALDAEKRGYIEIKNTGLNWSLKKSI